MMSLFHKNGGGEGSPPAPPQLNETMKRKFDIAYFLANEGLAFRKMKPLCQLQKNHGVKLQEQFALFIFINNQSLVAIHVNSRGLALQCSSFATMYVV